MPAGKASAGGRTGRARASGLPPPGGSRWAKSQTTLGTAKIMTIRRRITKAFKSRRLGGKAASPPLGLSAPPALGVEAFNMTRTRSLSAPDGAALSDLPEDDAPWAGEDLPLSAGPSGPLTLHLPALPPGQRAPRLDKALAAAVPEDWALSRSRLMRLIAEGALRLEGGPALTDPSAPAPMGQALCLHLPAPADSALQPEAIPLTILWEDEDLLVVDKPAGMVVHPAPGSPNGTLVNALLHHFGGALSGVGGQKRPGIVHRIDKDTSGLLVVAKSDRAHHGLAAQFAAHDLRRHYLALCYGLPEPAEPRLAGLRGVSFEPGGLIRIGTGLARHPKDRQRQAVSWAESARAAVTRVKRLESVAGGQAALMECRLETGRTHQIRVHMAYIGHGLMGDAVYGGTRRLPARLGPAAEAAARFPRQALHAASLGFRHPVSGAEMDFESPLPPDLQALHKALGGT